MQRVGLIVIVILGLLNVATARPNGAPKGACNNLEPKGHLKKTNTFDKTKNMFTIASACYVFMPGESMLMRPWATLGSNLYKGVLAQVRRVDTAETNYKNLLSGTFAATSPATKGMKCSTNSDTITHTSNNEKRDDEEFFRWTAPATCAPNEEYEIRATIVKEFESWQTGITVPLVCNPDYSNSKVMERVRPPLSVQYCSVQSWAIIPKELTTSFEMGFDGWGKVGMGAGKEWVRANMPTPTAGTGPGMAKNDDGAGEPEYFLHYEASGGSPGDIATLVGGVGGSGLQGCFCFSFWCHMKTQGEIEFKIRAVGTYVKHVLSTKEITPDWRQVKVTFISDHAIMLIIDVIRGSSHVADVGLDEISIVPGTCTAPALFVDMTKP